MRLKEVINLDCREGRGREVLQECLKKIKPLSRCEGGVPFSKIEKVLNVLSKKYNMRIREVAGDVLAAEEGIIWRAVIMLDETLEVIEMIYGLSLYEVFAKTAIYMYNIRGNISLRKEL